MTTSSKNEMTRDRFDDLVNSYGANPRRWPEEKHAHAEAFIASNKAVAKEILGKATQLDMALDTARTTMSDASLLAARILKQANEIAPDGRAANDTVMQAPLVRTQAPWKTMAATLLITTGIGFSAGQAAASNSTKFDTAEALLSLDSDNAYDSGNLLEDLQ